MMKKTIAAGAIALTGTRKHTTLETTPLKQSDHRTKLNKNHKNQKKGEKSLHSPNTKNNIQKCVGLKLQLKYTPLLR